MKGKKNMKKFRIQYACMHDLMTKLCNLESHAVLFVNFRHQFTGYIYIYNIERGKNNYVDLDTSFRIKGLGVHVFVREVGWFSLGLNGLFYTNQIYSIFRKWETSLSFLKKLIYSDQNLSHPNFKSITDESYHNCGDVRSFY